VIVNLFLRTTAHYAEPNNLLAVRFSSSAPFDKIVSALPVADALRWRTANAEAWTSAADRDGGGGGGVGAGILGEL